MTAQVRKLSDHQQTVQLQWVDLVVQTSYLSKAVKIYTNKKRLGH